MQLSSKGRYAVMAMADVARHADGGRAGKAAEEAVRPVSIASVSERQQISQTFLEQIFMQLRRGGLVTSSRGPGGGYMLARDAGEISILEVMQAVDEPVQMTRCSLAEGSLDGVGGCVAGNRCLTHGLWQDLGEHIISFLENTSLRDVIARPANGQPLEAMVFEATSDSEVVA